MDMPYLLVHRGLEVELNIYFHNPEESVSSHRNM